jgi:hypothetical protein
MKVGEIKETEDGLVAVQYNPEETPFPYQAWFNTDEYRGCPAMVRRLATSGRTFDEAVINLWNALSRIEDSL